MADPQNENGNTMRNKYGGTRGSSAKKIIKRHISPVSYVIKQHNAMLVNIMVQREVANLIQKPLQARCAQKKEIRKITTH